MKNLLKKITTSLVVLIMITTTIIPQGVLADTTDFVIDVSKKGSLTLTKKDTSTEHKPIKGVEYTIYKIADIKQGNISIIEGNSKVSVIYDSLMVDKANNKIEVPEESTNANAETLYAQIANKDSLVKKTGESETDGVVSFTELDLGVYLVYESKRPAGVSQGQSFIVSIPMTNKDEDNNYTKWNYDVVATPKNNITPVNIDKGILVDKGNNVDTPSDDTTSNGEDYQIGDSVPYQIKAGVPVNVHELKYYFIKDILSTGLTFNNDVIAYAIKDGTKVPLTAKTVENAGDYEVVVGTDNTFNVYFRTGALDGCSEVYIEYTAKLNEGATVGTAGGNINDVELSYSHTTSSGFEDEPNKPGENDELDKVNPNKPAPVVYTYQVSVKKTDKDGKPLAGVEFELRDQNGTKINVTGDNGVYTIKVDGNSTITTPTSGIITIKGLEDGQYQLVETKTVEGYILLKEPIIINVKSTVTNESYTEKDNGDYFKVEEGKKYYTKVEDNIYKLNLDGFNIDDYAKFEGAVYTSEDDAKEGTNDVIKYIRYSEKNTITTTSNYPINNDVISLTVVNKKGFVLPKTGAMGTYVFVFCGLISILAALFVIRAGKKVA